LLAEEYIFLLGEANDHHKSPWRQGAF
jgi:hypothetical protein